MKNRPEPMTTAFALRGEAYAEQLSPSGRITAQQAFQGFEAFYREGHTASTAARVACGAEKGPEAFGQCASALTPVKFRSSQDARGLLRAPAEAGRLEAARQSTRPLTPTERLQQRAEAAAKAAERARAKAVERAKAKADKPKPKVAKPKADEPEVVVPKADRTKAAKPKADKAKVAKSKAAKPEAAKPKAAKPKAAKPKADKPKAAKPKADKPKATKPKATKDDLDLEGLFASAVKDATERLNQGAP